jgi:hypothetical protein
VGKMGVGTLMFGLTVWLAAAASAQVACGDVLGPGGTYVLTADLVCPTIEPSLTLVDGAQLDLQGHTLLVDAVVVLAGSGTVLRNGGIQICRGGGVCAGGTAGVVAFDGGGHRLEGLVVINGGGAAIVLESSGNLVQDCTLVGDQGVSVSGDANVVRRVVVTKAHIGIDVEGMGNVLVQNVMNQVNGESYLVYGDGNTLLKNIVREGVDGFVVFGAGNRLIGNMVEPFPEAVGMDAFDASGTCTANTWLLNTYETADPACLLDFPHRRMPQQVSGVMP